MPPVIILHNLRSIYNVGSILRSAACFANYEVYCTGYTPYPSIRGDKRLPHIVDHQTKAISKVSLGAEKLLSIHHGNISEIVDRLKSEGYKVVACEQTSRAVSLQNWLPVGPTAVIFGNEPNGIELPVLSLADQDVEIPMSGQKSSLNVANAAAIVLQHWSQAVIHKIV